MGTFTSISIIHKYAGTLCNGIFFFKLCQIMGSICVLWVKIKQIFNSLMRNYLEHVWSL